MQHENFDGQISHGLKQYKPVYREEYWKNMEARLDAGERRSKRFTWGSLLLPAAIVTVAIMAAVIPYTFNTAEQEVSLPAVKGNTEIAVKEDQPQLLPDQKNPGTKKEAVAILADKNITDNNNKSVNLIAEKPANADGFQLAPVGPKVADAVLTDALLKSQPFIAEERLQEIAAERILEKLPLIQPGIAAISAASSGIIPATLKQKKQNHGIASTPWQGLIFNFWDNPAYTGNEGKASLVLDHNFAIDQGFHKLNNNESVGADFRLMKGLMAVGVYYNRDVAPFSIATESGVTASARVLKLGHGNLKTGVGLSLLTRQFSESLDAFKTIDRINPALRTFSSQEHAPYYNSAVSAQAGLWYDSKNLIAGLNVKNFNRPKLSARSFDEKLPVEYSLNAGYNFDLAGFKLMPWLDISKATGAHTQYAGTVFFSYKNIAMLGAGLNDISNGSNDGRFVIYTGTELNDRLRLFTSVSRCLSPSKFGPANPTIIHSGIRYRMP